MQSPSDFELEIQKGTRFKFGKNWRDFLSTLDSGRIQEAEISLKEMLGVADLSGKSFLDIGSGSGLFSLAARRLGANVYSFDYDPQSVECARQLKSRFFDGDNNWRIERGSALDRSYLGSAGQFDIVYSWGVLHHTGRMWEALENAALAVKPNGFLFIAIYNDQGWISDFWRLVKKIYCAGLLPRLAVSALFFPYFFLRSLAKSVVNRRNEFALYRKQRGMSLLHDWRDWLGGLPFEVASPVRITAFYEKRGFALVKITTTTSLGNNQFVFKRIGNNGHANGR